MNALNKAFQATVKKVDGKKQTMYPHPTMQGVKVSSKKLREIWEKERTAKVIEINEELADIKERMEYHNDIIRQHRLPLRKLLKEELELTKKKLEYYQVKKI